MKEKVIQLSFLEKLKSDNKCRCWMLLLLFYVWVFDKKITQNQRDIWWMGGSLLNMRAGYSF